VRRQDKENKYKYVIGRAFNNVKNCKMITTPSTILVNNFVYTCKQLLNKGEQHEKAHKITMKEGLQNLIPPYLNISFLLPTYLCFHSSCLPFAHFTFFVPFFFHWNNFTFWEKKRSHLTRGVSHCGLAIYIKKFLKAKEELWRFEYLTIRTKSR
jgi:hypothetical protein